MTTYTSPTSLSSSHPANVSSQASSLPADLSPSTLDTLPILTSILSRLQTGLNNPANALLSSSPQNGQSQPSSIDKSPFSTAALTTKDIPTATDDLKHGIRKAKSQIAQLPDMDRSIAEQEEEIREIEARIAEQKMVLQRLGELGKGVTRKDQEMA
ncbi:MAG: hypothetical protein M1818_003180 [Claussenomyces sp. TS43310]|nr:MAG: hypothetical protein M1818_003180 [Claussenomyces sp. TS43310]